MANETIPGTGHRVRSPINNARNVGRKWDGTSVSPKTLSDLKSVAIAKVTGPGANGVIELSGPIVGVSHVLAYETATGQWPGVNPPVPLEGTDYEVVSKNASGNGEVRELAGTDRSAETWIIHYQPDAEDIDVPQSEKGDVFSPLPLA